MTGSFVLFSYRSWYSRDWAISIALKATEAGSEPGSDFTILASTLLAHSSNWSIAAALNVSHAEKRTLLLFCINIFPNFPIVVVLPTPLTPETNIIFVFSFFKYKC